MKRSRRNFRHSLFVLVAAAAIAPGVAADANIRRSAPVLRPEDRSLLEATVRIQDEVSASVWPGFVSFRSAVLLFSDEGQFLLGASTAPAYFKPYPGTAPLGAEGNWWTDANRDNFGLPMPDEKLNKLPINETFDPSRSGGNFPYTVFFIDSLSRYHRKGQPWVAEDWMGIYWHEMFHTYQHTQYDPKLVTPERVDDEPFKPLISSAAFLAAVREEQETMSSALKARSPVEKRRWACEEFLPRRDRRHAAMRARGETAALRAEPYQEMAEGTARYVEELMAVATAALSDADLRKLDQGLPLNKDYGRYAHWKGRTREFYFDKIVELPKSGRYWYPAGFSMALFLDQVDPGWKKDVFCTDGFLEAKLRRYCAGPGAR